MKEFNMMDLEDNINDIFLLKFRKEIKGGINELC